VELREQLEQQKQARRRLRRDALALGQQLRELGHPDADTLEDATADEVQRAAGQLLSRLADGSERFQELVELQADWLERLADHTEFQGAFLQARHVIAGTCIGLGGIRALRELEFDVCILDEASKATATEALVPLARTRRWVLVGDARQLPPFQEEVLQHAGLVEKYALDRQELLRTLFERLAEGLPSSCIKELTTQHRMARPIGDLISHCFYGGALQSVSEQTLLGLALPAPVTWYDTSHLPNRFEEATGTGFRNRQEAKEVVELLDGLARCVERGLLDAPEGRRLSVLVMSGYLMQRDEIRKLLARRRLDRRLDVEVNTVDAVQGREADIAVFSVTRSNQDGRLGFLDVSPRINVALSRGRYGLVIFGDADFCAQKRTPLADVLRHVRSHPDGYAVVRVGQ
jgi:superfamily I DNA and/or RNA helicase